MIGFIKNMKIINKNSTRSQAMYCCFVVCVFIGLQVFSAQAYSATSKYNNFNQLLSKADLIVFGKCIDVTSEWRKKKIYSIATIQVDEVVKGSASSEIQIEYMGGTALHPKLNTPIKMNVSNGIDFSAGDEAVLILRRLPSNRFQVAGSSRGKIAVVTDAASGEKMIQSGARKIQSKPSAKGDSTVLSGKQMNLQEFLDYLGSQMRTEKKRAKQ